MTKTVRPADNHLADTHHSDWAELSSETPSSKEIAEAIDHLSDAVSMGSGASPSAQRVLDFCFKGNDSDTLSLLDLCRLDADNQGAALLLIKLAASVRHPLPKDFLTR